MKSILYAVLIIHFGLSRAYAQSPNETMIKMKLIELKKIDNVSVDDFNFSVPCIVTQPALEESCDSLNLFISDKNESSKNALQKWFSNNVKATDPLTSSHDLARGDFDLKGPGKTSLFCTKCNTGLTKGAINSMASRVDDTQFKDKLKNAYLEKQAENWANRFQNIRNNIDYLQVDAEIHGLSSDNVNAVAAKCSMEKMEESITRFIDKQEKMAAKTGSSNCPALRNVDINKFIKIFRRDSKVKEQRLGSFKQTSEQRMSSISFNVKSQYSTSCVNEALFQKSWGGFTPAEAVNLILHTPNEKLNEKDFALIVRNSILNDPKYNFMMTDPKQVAQLELLVSQLMKEVYAPLLDEYKKQKAKINLDDVASLKQLDPLLDRYQSKVANVLNNFDKDRFASSVEHLKGECDALVGSHLEAVICHDPSDVDLTDLDLMANLNVQPSLEECIYENRYNVDGIKNMTPFCAKFLQNYCVSDQQSYTKNLSVEDKQYRKVLGAAHMQQRNFQALKTKSLANNPDYMKAIDNFEKNVCTQMISNCKKKYPFYDKDSREFREKLEDLTLDYISSQKASDHYGAGDEVVRSLVDSLDSEKEKKRLAKLDENKEMSPDQIKEMNDPGADGYRNGKPEDTNNVGVLVGSIGAKEDDSEGPTYIGLDDELSDSVIGDGKIIESDGTTSNAQSMVNNNQNIFSNKPTVSNTYVPLPVRSTDEIKKDEKALESSKTQISSLKKQLEEKKEIIGSSYKSDPDYLAKEKKLKELEDKTRELERKLLAEKDQRIKELEKQLAGKKEGDKDYKKLYEELNQTIEGRNTLANNGAGGGNSNLPVGTFAANNNSVVTNPSQVGTPSAGSSSGGSGNSTNYLAGPSGSSNQNSSSNNITSSSGGAGFVVPQNSKPSDVSVITLTIEEFKSINQPNLENARKAVEEILKKHNGPVIGDRLYVQTIDDKGNVIYHSIDLKILKTGEKEKVAVVKKQEKKEKKDAKKDRTPSARVEDLENALKN